MTLIKKSENVIVVGCDFYRKEIGSFEGCPGLDYYNDGDECGDCKYRLSNVIQALKSYNPSLNQTDRSVDRDDERDKSAG